jgi:hypothetical protein
MNMANYETEARGTNIHDSTAKLSHHTRTLILLWHAFLYGLEKATSWLKT